MPRHDERDSGEDDSQPEHTHETQEHRGRQKEPVRSGRADRKTQDDPPEEKRGEHAHRGGRHPREGAPHEIRKQPDRRDVDVLERFVVFPVPEYRPGDSDQDLRHIKEERVSDEDELEGFAGRVSLGNDLHHEKEDQRRRKRFGDRVGQKEDRVRPIRLDLPSQPGRGAENPREPPHPTFPARMKALNRPSR